MTQVVRIGTRGSALALRQTEIVADLLRAAWPALTIEIQVISTRGDQIKDVPLAEIGGEGAFTSAIESALRADLIDVAVHSLKDLPVTPNPGTIIAAIPERAYPADVMVSRAGYTLDTLPENARIGTSSSRRAAQMRHYRPDLRVLDIRGNVDTRLRKAFDPDGEYDAILLARAGLDRLGRTDVTDENLPLDVILPAPGQAALAVQCRDEVVWINLLRPLNHPPTAAAVTAERAFLAGLGGGCSLPVAAYAIFSGGALKTVGRVLSADGATRIDVEDVCALSDPDPEVMLKEAENVGRILAQTALTDGAALLLSK